MRHLLLLAAAGCGTSLPPEGQVLLFIDTDAPVTGSSEAPLFDRLRIDIFPEGATIPCAGCSREIAIDEAAFAEARTSIGIVPEPGDRVGVRVRLHRHGGTASGEPRAASTLEAFARLPAVDEEGIVEATVFLATERVGRPEGTLADPIDALEGRPAASRVSSFSGAVSRSCAAPPGQGEVCVPGGAYFMGDPLLDLSAVEDMGGQHERLVVVSPFFLDATEVTVAAFRASGLARSLVPGGPSDNPHEANTGIAGCVYTSQPSDADPLPVNCISWDLSAEYCAHLGKRLPTEAELELAMSARGRGRHVWGDAPPSCADAVYARTAECAAFGPSSAPPGTGARDFLVLPTGTILDLAGNLHEWAADQWHRDDEACWQEPLLYDPRCDWPSAVDPPGRSARGGSFTGDAWSTAAAIRFRLFNETQAVSNDLGFRCARDGG